MNNSKKCRTCLAQNRKLKPLLELSTASNNTLHLSDVFMMCASVEIAPNDEFSQNVCSKCITSAEKAYLFKKQCEYSDKVWKEFSRRIKQKPVSIGLETPEISVGTANNKCGTIECTENQALIVIIESENGETDDNQEIGNKADKDPDIKSIEIHEEAKTELNDRPQRPAQVSRRYRKRKPIPRRQRQLATWPQACNYCSLLLNSHKEKITHRNQEHGDLKTFVCERCGKRFFYEHYLRTHAETHEEARRLMCQYCGKSFATTSNLIRHIRIHTGEKPFKCEKCGVRLARWCSLNYHRSMHSLEKNYECKECHKKFVSHTMLRLHMRTHTGGYRCHLCPEKLATPNSLRRHLKTHPGPKQRNIFEPNF